MSGLKIAWVSHTAALGGAERCLVEAVRGLSQAGHVVHVAIPHAGELESALRAAGAEVTTLPFAWWVHPGESWKPAAYYRIKRAIPHRRDARRMAEWLRGLAPDLVVTNTLTVATGARASRLAGLPHVWYLHEFGREDHNLRFDGGEARALREMDRLSTSVVANSEAVARRFKPHFAPGKVSVVEYAVEIPRDALAHPATPSPDDSAPLRLLLMGQMTPGKGQEDAVRAVALLRDRGVLVALSLVGSQHHAAYVGQLHALVEALGVADRVTLRGPTEDPFAEYRRADGALVCSRSEAFGRVTVEAMKMGLPVIGADAGGTSELIAEGVSGLHYPPGDAEALADLVERLHRDRISLRAMGKAARAGALERFIPARYAEGLAAVFQAAVREGRAAR